MKGAMWVMILLGVLGVVYLLARDLKSVGAERGGTAVIEPLQKAKAAAGAASSAQAGLEDGLKKSLEQ